MSNNSYGNSTHVPPPGQNPSPSSSQAVNATPNGLSFSGPVFQPELNETQHDFFQLAPQQPAPIVNVFQAPMPLLVRNSGNPSHEHPNNNAAATPNTFQGGQASIYGQPALPNVLNRQTGEGASFTGQPPTMTTFPPNPQPPYPGVYTRLNEQGVPGPLWQLTSAMLDPVNSDEIHVVIVFKRIQFT